RGVTARTPFTWNAIPNADGYFLYVGTTPGAQDVVSSGTITTTSFKAQYLQPYSTLYARLYTRLGGIWRRSADVAFATGSLASEFVYPVRGTVGLQAGRAFEWGAIADADGYQLIIS